MLLPDEQTSPKPKKRISENLLEKMKASLVRIPKIRSNLTNEGNLGFRPSFQSPMNPNHDSSSPLKKFRLAEIIQMKKKANPETGTIHRFSIEFPLRKQFREKEGHVLENSFNWKDIQLAKKSTGSLRDCFDTDLKKKSESHSERSFVSVFERPSILRGSGSLLRVANKDIQEIKKMFQRFEPNREKSVENEKFEMEEFNYKNNSSDEVVIRDAEEKSFDRINFNNIFNNDHVSTEFDPIRNFNNSKPNKGFGNSSYSSGLERKNTFDLGQKHLKSSDFSSVTSLSGRSQDSETLKKPKKKQTLEVDIQDYVIGFILGISLNLFGILLICLCARKTKTIKGGIHGAVISGLIFVFIIHGVYVHRIFKEERIFTDKLELESNKTDLQAAKITKGPEFELYIEKDKNRADFQIVKLNI